MSDQKLRALAEHIGESPDEIEELDDSRYEFGRAEYLVLTDEEADQHTEDYIRESVWAFRPEFLEAHGVPLEVSEAFAQANLCESANEALYRLVDDWEHFIADAIRADGRGHFLSSYDGEEHEVGEFFIYRTN